MRKRAVITIHGIRTRGEWQKHLAPVLAARDLVPYPLDYGRFSAAKLVWPPSQEKQINWFHEQYDIVRSKSKIDRPSIVAHSFGSYMVCKLLERYNEVKFDKILLAGSIATETFPWRKIIKRGQVLSVLNEVATEDIWPAVAKCVVRGAGGSGRNGFLGDRSDAVEQRFSPIDHSGTFFGGRYEEWAEWLANPRRLATKDLEAVQALLQFAAERAATQLQVPPKMVRSNIFLSIDDCLQIPEGAQCRMDSAVERTIRIPYFMGSTGRAFTKRAVYAAFRVGESWGEAGLPESELKKANPDLIWILSFPLLDPTNNRVFGVMNIDGLVVSPVLGPELNEAAQELIAELENAHSKVIAARLCQAETGGFSCPKYVTQ